MKRLALVLMVSTLLLVGGPAIAEMCTIDAVPAATLLLPYFAVDLTDSNGVNTLFSINNASAAPALAHVSFYTDWSWPTIDFDVFLTGYDVQIINLRNVFENGDLPITADRQSDPEPADAISPHQTHPVWDGSFNNCENILPFYVNPLIAGTNFTRLVKGHTGQEVNVQDIDGCVGADHSAFDDGHTIARGYITIDNVNQCNTVFPSDPIADGYFANNGTGIANNNNQLWGEYFLVDPTNNYAQGETLVHIEAEDDFIGGLNSYTYYARYSNTIANADNREPLGETWGARYLNNALFSGGTDFLVWRDSTAGTPFAGGYVCGGPDSDPGVGPAWFPLNEVQVVAFDEEERAARLCFTGQGGVISPQDPADDPACFPLETQKISSENLGFAGIGSPWQAGWMYLNLAVGDDGPFIGPSEPDFDPAYLEGAQSYVSVSHSADGRYSVGLQAIELTSACSDSDVTLTDVCTPNYVPGFPGGETTLAPCTIPFAGN